MTDEIDTSDLRPGQTPPHAAEMLEQAVAHIDLAHFWATHQRPDLSTAYTNMAKLMLIEGNGKGSEAEFWVFTSRAAIAEIQGKPAFAVECASRAHALGELLFVAEPLKLGIARGNLGKAIFLLGRHEEARKWLSQGIFALSAASYNPPAGAPEKLKHYYREAFIDYSRVLQKLPARPRKAS